MSQLLQKLRRTSSRQANKNPDVPLMGLTPGYSGKSCKASVDSSKHVSASGVEHEKYIRSNKRLLPPCWMWEKERILPAFSSSSSLCSPPSSLPFQKRRQTKNRNSGEGSEGGPIVWKNFRFEKRMEGQRVAFVPC